MKFKLICPLNPTGVGIHAQHLVNALINRSQEGFEFEIVPQGLVKHSVSASVAGQIRTKLMHQRYIENPDAVIILDVPQKCISWSRDNRMSMDNVPLVLYSVFELEYPGQDDRVPWPEYREMRDRSSHRWFPSAWACAQFGRGVMNPFSSVVLREGAYKPFECSLQKRADQAEVVKIASIGKFEKRKGHYALIRALPAMQTNSYIELHTFWHNFWVKNAAIDHMHRSDYMHDKRAVDGTEVWRSRTNRRVTVHIHKHMKWQQDVLGKVSGYDLAVFPTFAEGWGLPITECMAMGIPTIAVNHTGPSEYWGTYDRASMKSSVNGWRCPTRFHPPLGRSTDAQDGVFFPGGKGSWYEISDQEVAQTIQRAVEDPIRLYKYKVMLSCGLDEFRETFSWESSATRLLKLLGG